MVHLHVHSKYSFLKGTASCEALVQECVNYNIPALALTDTGGLYGIIPFYQTAQKAGVKPIIGTCLDNIVLLAKNYEGYKLLCQIVTRYHTDSQTSIHGYPSWLDKVDNNLFVLTDDISLAHHLRRIGISPLIAITYSGTKSSQIQARQVYDFALAKKLMPVAVNPIYYLKPEHLRIHRVLTAIRQNTTISTVTDVIHPNAWFRSPQEMTQLYRDFPNTIANTEYVAECCNVTIETGKIQFPHFTPENGESAFLYLRNRAEQGLKGRYKQITPKIKSRLENELQVIDQLGFSPYFLIVADIVDFARSQDIPIVGRGSAANSIVAYALGITQVDPIQHDLYFERFLNPFRSDCPDIDLDICWRRRDQVIDYVYRKYGDDHVAMISTHNTFRARAALRETAKALGFTSREINRIVSRIPHYHAQDIRILIESLPECRELKLNEDPLKSIITIAEFIDGFPRHLSIHAGGLVIAPCPITQIVPLQRAAKGILITQYDMDPIETLGLVKMDLLGHRALTVIHDTARAIQQVYGVTIDLDHLPDPDPLTAELLQTGATIGCFQIESPAMRALLRNTFADTTDMLIKTLSLIRPGPSGSGMKKHFIARRLNQEPTEYLHPVLNDVLNDTYGIMLYQEDILKVAHAIAGISLAEADSLRRAITKKSDPTELGLFMKTFRDKALANGVAEDVTQKIWELIANFAKYSYCKAHACTYGMLAYQCAYLKAHFPAEFFAAVLSNRGGFYHAAVYFEEARRLGIEILPPDLNRSEYHYTTENGAIRVGFIEIRNLSSAAVHAILAQRSKRVFSSFADFCHRTAIGYGDVVSLIESGACDSMGLSRPELLWEAKQFYSRRTKDLFTKSARPQSHFSLQTTYSIPYHLCDYSSRMKFEQEWISLGFPLKSPPFRRFFPLPDHLPFVLSPDLTSYAGCQVVLMGWLIAERRVGVRSHGVMKFLTFEDPAGIFEAVLFPETYNQFGGLMLSQGPYIVSGIVQHADNYSAIIVDQLQVVTRTAKPPIFSDITPPMSWLALSPKQP